MKGKTSPLHHGAAPKRQKRQFFLLCLSLTVASMSWTIYLSTTQLIFEKQKDFDALDLTEAKDQRRISNVSDPFGNKENATQKQNDFKSLTYQNNTITLVDSSKVISTEPSTNSQNNTSSKADENHNSRDGNKREIPSSLAILFATMKSFKPPDNYTFDQDITDPMVEQDRCKQYGFEYTGRKKRRRIFFGSLIADDSWHALLSHAAEAHGLYHSVAFVESNATTSWDPTHSRTIRFGRDSSALKTLESGIFGPDAKVTVDYYVDNPEERRGENVWNGVEHMQRELIAHRWKKNGMKVDDIGIIGDTDEMFSRDFLLAAQSCDVPEFRPNQDCHRPKIFAFALVFESSPECITGTRRWFHPDMIIGECIDGIGDSDVHKPGKRKWNGKGPREVGYGEDPNDYSKMPNVTMYPLWKPEDFRLVAGGRRIADKNGAPIAFHIHNFFLSMTKLRNKYLTYSHPDAQASTKPLYQIHKDLNFTNNCVMERPDDPNYHGWDPVKDRWKRVKGGFDALVGPRPILFKQSAQYRKARQEELKEMILKDEEQFGGYAERKIKATPKERLAAKRRETRKRWEKERQAKRQEKAEKREAKKRWEKEQQAKRQEEAKKQSANT